MEKQIDIEGAYEAVEKALRSQGARHSREKLLALTQSLMEGGAPQTYGERVAQMTLEIQGFLPRAN